jgi:hypothetical protein
MKGQCCEKCAWWDEKENECDAPVPHAICELPIAVFDLAEVALRVNLYDELVEALCGVVRQGCWDVMGEGFTINSDAALTVLAKAGKVKIIKQHGRRVIAEWVKEKP